MSVPSVEGDSRAAIEYLSTPEAIRERCERIYSCALSGGLDHFTLHEERLEEVVELVAKVTLDDFPQLEIPYHSRWRHFDVGGIDRLAPLRESLDATNTDERARCEFDLVVTSVLLDAGAGPAWKYTEMSTGLTLTRSEGLAVASLEIFRAGTFSSDADAPLRADAKTLRSVSPETLAAGLQAGQGNPLVGLEGRTSLLQALGKVVAEKPHIFGAKTPRVGGLYDYIRPYAKEGYLSTRAILSAILEGLGPIWPGRLTLDSTNLGDVGRHRAAGGSGASAGLVPFHKLSQWLAYSLFEPLERAGITIVDSDALTGLAEYRNGGLFVDTGVLIPKYSEVTQRAHRPDSEIVVEWRALTIALLDRLAERLRSRLSLDTESLPLAKVLEGGSWKTGRQLARERRADGTPPIQIESDGTFF